ncbi:hypothetical protein [Candidatus Mesenet endosymbiont of Phosphuga atrata]|uniref:hypothetical protein n=1 Tax=Candidatus Mesenet endosymbiont of Phosphuga atrata TaxID=3066221 RepID=UPI0030D3E6EB
MSETKRGYPLPHPDNITVEDIVRIRKTIVKVDEDISLQESEHLNLKDAFARFSFETFLNLWGNK